ncbi:hypothetical protein RJ640_001633, partial [Escallonia rubra]
MEQKMLRFLENSKSIRQFKQTHLQIIINGLQDYTFLVPKLISLSSNLISIDYAVKIFRNSQLPNVVAYNTMIKCFIGKTHKDALHTYNHMRLSSISPNSFTFTFLLRCFESFEYLQDGLGVHGHVVKLGFDSSVFVLNTLLDFYAKCSQTLDFACRVFEEMPEKDVVTWNTMISAYMDIGEIDSAIKLFESMPERNIVTWNSVIGGLSKCGSMELARSVFERMPERNEVSWNSMVSGYVKVGDVGSAVSMFNAMPVKTIVSCTTIISGYMMNGDVELARKVFDHMPAKNVVSWNAMIAGYVHNHMFDQALSLFHHMLIDGKCRPDQTTLVSVVSACTHLGSLEHGKWINFYLRKKKVDLSVPLGNSLIDMFAKCGDVEDARAVFDQMAKRCIVTWTTMISGLAVNGHCVEALSLFERMLLEGLKPDDVIFIAVLSACTHGGLVEEGKRIFGQMVHEFDIKPRIEHYGCMVDLLGRAGKLEEAVSFIESMRLEPNVVIWATLLCACKIHGDGELFESVTRKMLEKEPSHFSYLPLITSLSSSVGRRQDAMSFRKAMKNQGIEKVPGCSSIQIADGVHEFTAKDVRHVERKEIYRVLNILDGQRCVIEVGTLKDIPLWSKYSHPCYESNKLCKFWKTIAN